jgi:hypothetical protein
MLPCLVKSQRDLGGRRIPRYKALRSHTKKKRQDTAAYSQYSKKVTWGRPTGLPLHPSRTMCRSG